MNRSPFRYGLILIALLAVTPPGFAQEEPAEEKAWPRVMDAKDATVTMYQPQIDSWRENDFEARAAVSVKEGEGAPIFGAVWISGRFEVDTDTRMVTLNEITIPSVAFPEASEERQQQLKDFLEREIPKWDLEFDLDRVIPLLDNAEVALREETQLKHDPPEIIVTYIPAVLILIDGEPKLEEIENSTLERVINTPYIILKFKSTYYLASDSAWFEAWSINGPWTEARSLPKDVQEVDRQLKEQAQEQGASAPDEAADTRTPEIVVSTVPAELIFIDGQPELEPLSASEIMVVSNTDSDVVFEIASQNYYVLLSGRWYRTKDLDNGPWTWVANDELSVQFAEIPADSDVGYLRASVAGTEEAREALLEQSVPQTADVKTTAGASFSVTYDGAPEFKPIDGTKMTWAVNTSAAVIWSGGRYYACDQGIWYDSTSATGPWTVSKNVPDEIYTIPPSHPHYNVTYVKVYDSSPEVVYVGYTPGYTSSYVSHGCVVYGTGWWYRPWWGPWYYPRPATWGFHVRWNPWYGWGFGVSWSTGRFTFSIGFGGWGGWGWRGGWWGPGFYRPYPRYGYGAAYRAGFRHGYAHGRHAASRPTHFGNNNIYSRPTNADRVAQTRDRAGTRQQPAVARDRSNNVYTDRNGNVYRRNENGSWDRRQDGGWSRTETPSAGTRPSTGTQPSTRPLTGAQPSTRPSTGSQPSTRPSTRPSAGPRPSTGSYQRPSSGSSLNRDYSARQRGSTRSMQYGGGRASGMSRGGGARRR
jgi:hypothetical protein